MLAGASGLVIYGTGFTLIDGVIITVDSSSSSLSAACCEAEGNYVLVGLILHLISSMTTRAAMIIVCRPMQKYMQPLLWLFLDLFLYGIFSSTPPRASADSGTILLTSESSL